MGRHLLKLRKKYTAPLEFSQTTTLNTIAYRGNVASETKAALIEKQNYLESLNITPKTGALQRWTGVKQFKIVDSVALPKNATYQFVTVINLAGNEGIEQLSMVFKGYFYAEAEGLYEFATKSDDGSLLFIGDKMVVDNGGNHSAIEKNGMVALQKGWHPITIKYHEATGGGELSVSFKAPNGEKQVLKGNVIAHD